MKGILAGIYLVLGISPVLGQWQRIEDFQNWSSGQIITVPSEIDWYSVSLFSDGNSEFWMLDDPYDSANISMYVDAGLTNSWGWNEVWVSKELPDDGISPGETGTLYFRCLFSGFDGNWHIGTADKTLAFDPETWRQTAPGGWDDFNALISVDKNGYLVHRDGDTYVQTNPPVSLEVNKWYQFWLVVENTWDISTAPPISTGVYRLYIEGPGIGYGARPTLISVGTSPPKDYALFRRVPEDEEGNPNPIRWLMLGTDSKTRSGCPSCGSPFLLDDIYFTDGKNLGDYDPGDPWWQLIETDEHGNVDTGDFFGWINIRYFPYVWFYSINSWVYFRYGPNDWGWVYFYK